MWTDFLGVDASGNVKCLHKNDAFLVVLDSFVCQVVFKAVLASECILRP